VSGWVDNRDVSGVSAVDVIGREPEEARIGAFLAGVAGGARTLALRGEPGIGKTTLWRQAVADARDNGGRTYLGLRVEIRAAAGIEVGDPVEVVLEHDDAPREVAVPAALDAALDGDAAARAVYDALAFTHRREYAEWIASAKREETRERRVARALEMLHAGIRHP
jgi:hypothetical protein